MEGGGWRTGKRKRKRRRRRRRRTNGNPRVINDVGNNHPSKLPLHRPLQGFISIEGTASLEDNSLKILKHAKTLFSECQRHVST
eukprot:6733322-Pyramimonas_sp.AAC.1